MGAEMESLGIIIEWPLASQLRDPFSTMSAVGLKSKLQGGEPRTILESRRVPAPRSPETATAPGLVWDLESVITPVVFVMSYLLKSREIRKPKPANTAK